MGAEGEAKVAEAWLEIDQVGVRMSSWSQYPFLPMK